MDRSELNQLLVSLPVITFEIDKDSAVAQSAPAQKYLNYYHINFATELEGVRHGMGHFTVGSCHIATHYWLPDALKTPKGTLFIVHGYCDHVGLYQHLIRFALLNDCAVVAFDLPGHGLSSGEAAVINSFDAYTDVLSRCVELCREKMPQPWLATGQSTGGAILLDYLFSRCAKAGSPFEQQVLLAPLVRAHNWRYLRWLYESLRWLLKKIPRNFIINSHDEAFLDFLENKDPLQSRILSIPWMGAMQQWIKRFSRFEPRADQLLVIQGDDDTTVDWRYDMAVIGKKLPNADVKILAGARHQLVNESVAYRAQVMEHIKRYFEW